MPSHASSTVCIRGLPYLDATKEELANILQKRLETEQRTVVFTPNAGIAGEAQHNADLHRLLAEADLLLPDGAGILLASRRLTSHRLTHRLAGIEAGEMALSLAAAHGYPVYFLGGQPGVAEAAAKAWQQRLPTLIIAGTHHGYFDASGPENDRILRDVQGSGARVLFVCLGFPAQEMWIVQNKDRLPSVRLFMGLGGSLDVWAGRVHRAPALVRRIHLEWLWRMLASPRKFARLPTMLRFVFGR
ncbi:MAG: WecB/TagA/CpsF family glycosyltransferase [Ruminococcaceae bacterium]|nr:WecB/TagA/CpsF family glycosyltransferase [Oscillospiraceae bacterium]